MNLNFDDTEEEVDDTDRVQFFILVKVYEPECWNFGFTSPDPLDFYLYKINIFLHYEVINRLVNNFALILLVNFFNKAEHFMSTAFDHVLVVNGRDTVWKVFHFLVVQQFLWGHSIYQLDIFEDVVVRVLDYVLGFVEVFVLAGTVNFDFANFRELFPFWVFCHNFIDGLFSFEVVGNGFWGEHSYTDSILVGCDVFDIVVLFDFI